MNVAVRLPTFAFRVGSQVYAHLFANWGLGTAHTFAFAATIHLPIYLPTVTGVFGHAHLEVVVVPFHPTCSLILARSSIMHAHL